jgi:hypothetical protein
MKKKSTTARRWRVSIIRSAGEYLGTVEAPDERSAEIEAAERFKLTAEQRKRLLLREVAESDILVFEDGAEWRVEYFDEDGGCYVTVFSGPEAAQRALDYHSALLAGKLRPIPAERP